MNALFKNTTRLLSANVIAQAVGLLVYPLLTRIYSAADFGLLNLFVSIAGILILIATAEYQYAIMLPKDSAKAVSVFRLALLLTVPLLVFLFLSRFFSGQIATVLGNSSLAPWWRYMYAFVGLSALWNIQNYWLLRQKNFRAISAYQITQSLVAAAAKWAFGLAGLFEFGLLWASLIAMLAGLLVSCALGWKKTFSAFTTLPPLSQSCAELKSVAKEYIKFPCYNLPRSLVNTLSCSLPALLLSPFFGLSELGFFSMAFLFAFTPVNVIAKSIYQVLFQDLSQKVNNKEHISGLIFSFIKKTLLICGVGLVCLSFFLPQLMQWFLGTEYAISGEYIRVMLPWLLMTALVSPICFLSDVFQQQAIGLVFEIALFVMRLLGIGIGIWTNSFMNAVIGYSLAGALVVLGQLIWYCSLVRRYERTL